MPARPLIEADADPNADRHLLILQQEKCILYELYRVFQTPTGWKASVSVRFDLRSYQLRPPWWTSADAAGLPILPGLVRWEEVASGRIAHAVRFTAPRTRNAWVWPGRHRASSLSSPDLPPMGQRFRLRASFDTSGFSAQAKVILEALKQYGMLLADNGSPWYVSGAPNENWTSSLIAELKRVRGGDFEAVDTTSLIVNPDSGRARKR